MNTLDALYSLAKLIIFQNLYHRDNFGEEPQLFRYRFYIVAQYTIGVTPIQK